MKDSPGFISDISIRGTLLGVTLRSPVSKGQLKSISCPRLPNAYTLIRAEDIPGKNELVDHPVPVLAKDELSYFGQPVAILVGPDEARLEEYASQCQVEAEKELPALSFNAAEEDRILAKREILIGEPGKAFSEAASVVTGAYRTGIQEHWYSEPVGAIAVYSPEAMLIHTATQWPYHVRNSVSQVLGIDSEKVLVEPGCTGIPLDGKLWYPSLIACHAALGSWITKKPVTLILTREDDFRYSPKRNGAEIHISTALDAQGHLLGTDIQVMADMGAQGIFIDEILDRICLGSLGSYKHQNIKIQGFALKTNVPPQGPFAGFGLSQGFFAMERHGSRIADILGQDPAEWRKNNSVSRQKSLAIGAAVKDPIHIEALLDTTATMSDYHRKWASYELLRIRRRGEEGDPRETFRGIGIACAYQGSGFLYSGSDKGAYSVEITLDKDGALEIKTSMVPSNGEDFDIWRNIAAENLSVETASVRVVCASPGIAPDSGPDTLSRNSTILTKLVEKACQDIRKQRFRDPLPITVQRSYRPSRVLNWENKTFDAQALSQLSCAAAVVEVEIDPLEYTPKIRGAWIGVDAGKILSETRARRSLKFSAIQALGWASREHLAYEDGQIPLQSIYDYDIPSPKDIPPIQIDFIWNDKSPKGIEELPFSCIPAAYAQAVSQAIDHPFEKIPLTARDIWEAGKLKKQETPV
ncbi:putative aldehyde oxidase and xanthine dehydrogenase family protein [Treponema primitia ZAS-2]|uniref:Putative aldehyde oxidase and xanthine dehydrogenase family protein n=1 Tax=Treponema primitia (strain ATCC BAA-887 / DSM 12427 / ZAS-2) TaxID=545694 RepID=F5YHU8_TREPZ|nr:xanthine dehydrogenase family protein [Treponema primitia]AEF85886.1 putative aldehyde oxidase and xanthine dehydrogenase family protein [Treponema primitia ZAS-2]